MPRFRIPAKTSFDFTVDYTLENSSMWAQTDLLQAGTWHVYVEDVSHDHDENYSGMSVALGIARRSYEFGPYQLITPVGGDVRATTCEFDDFENASGVATPNLSPIILPYPWPVSEEDEWSGILAKNNDGSSPDWGDLDVTDYLSGVRESLNCLDDCSPHRFQFGFYIFRFGALSGTLRIYGDLIVPP